MTLWLVAQVNVRGELLAKSLHTRSAFVLHHGSDEIGRNIAAAFDVFRIDLSHKVGSILVIEKVTLAGEIVLNGSGSSFRRPHVQKNCGAKDSVICDAAS
jgi:hypothetical protein